MSKKKVIETATFIEEAIEVPEKVFAKVIGGKKLNIRAAKGLDAEIVGTLEDGAEIEILAKGREWCEVPNGFVKSSFLAF